MKNYYKIIGLFLVFITLNACEIENLADPNNPDAEAIENNASRADVQNLVNGIMSGIRGNMGTYLDGVGMIGREYYRFSASDPRFTSDLLGKDNAVIDNDTFYTTGPFNSRYRVIKNCNILINALQNSTGDTFSANEVNGGVGFAKTMKAHELLLVLNEQYTNGVRVDVSDPDNLGPFLSYGDSLIAIANLLDEGVQDLAAGDLFFGLGSGFSGNSFVEFNRAIKARVAVYMEDWNGAETALENSFLNDNPGSVQNLFVGPQYLYSAAGGDITNPMFYGPNASGEVRVAHPAFVSEAEAGDLRVANKTEMRLSPAVSDGLSSPWDITLYQTNTDNAWLIRNEELLLIKAEVDAQQMEFDLAVESINKIRNIHGLSDYSGAMNLDSIITEILKQRRYSLFGEGHRWIDMRRYDRLAELPIDREGDDVFEEFPRPAAEN